MTTIDKARDLARKLLALASQNPSVEEAAAAVAQAQRLAQLHDLDLDDLGGGTAAETEPERPIGPIGRHVVHSWVGRRIAWRETLWAAIARAHGVSPRVGPGVLSGWGETEQVEAAGADYHAVASYVDACAAEAVRTYQRRPDLDPRWDESPRVYGGGWRRGCSDAIARRLVTDAVAVDAVRAALPANPSTGALVRIDRAASLVARRAAAIALAVPKKSRTARSIGNAPTGEGYRDGRRAGDSAPTAARRAIRGVTP